MYGLLIALGIFTGAVIVEKQLTQKNEKTLLWNGIIWVVLGGILGARLYHVLDYYKFYSQNPELILQIWKGGLGIYGAMFGGIITLTLYAKRNNLELLYWLDLTGLAMPLGQAIGRLGNYFNNELLPYAIFEAIADFGLFVVLLKIKKSTIKKGTLFYFYLIGYGTIRFVLEPVKEYSWSVAGYNIAQSISILVILISGFLLWKNSLQKTSLKKK